MSNTISVFHICWYNLRGFTKNKHKLKMEKLEVTTKVHNVVGMLDTYLNQDEVDVMVKHNQTFFQNFHEPILIPKQSRGMMVLLLKTY